ncbi:MAG: AAA family ATPase [Magnetococcales bacterium]|nr:AAA family ATPase [Magnetococcales bacterium]
MLIHAIKLDNFLSFGDSSETIPLGPLNVIIGPNGSGKSNLLESIELLCNVSRELMVPADCLWKGAKGIPVASLSVVVTNPGGHQNLRYRLSFAGTGLPTIVDERVESENPPPGSSQPDVYYSMFKFFPA